MSGRTAASNGKWLVVGILALGVVLALVGLKFRRFPEGEGGVRAPAATQENVRGSEPYSG
jgi:hypothetical protein